MQQELRALPAYFLGTRTDNDLVQLYRNSDLLVFPSQSDTLGQVVMEAQACGLAALVSDIGGPRELVDDGLTGRVLAAGDAAAWVAAIDQLLDDAPLRSQMSRTAMQRSARFSMERCFEHFWADHLAVAQSGAPEPAAGKISHAEH
jgi:glycosyltransferase involved in cell wall biosynthesis